jgi:hypothetical protein
MEESLMIRMMVRHDVVDYGTWRNAYDEFDEERTRMGVRGDGVYRAVDNPNSITAYHDFDSIEAAQSFASSARLREVMEGAGVAGAPDIWFVEKA